MELYCHQAKIYLITMRANEGLKIALKRLGTTKLLLGNDHKIEPYLGEIKIDGIDYELIGDYLLSREEEIIGKKHHGEGLDFKRYDGTGPNSRSSRYAPGNIFTLDCSELEFLKEKIRLCYLAYLRQMEINRSNVWMQSWANIFRRKESLPSHVHNISEYAYLSAHITIKCDSTSTVYTVPSYEHFKDQGEVVLYESSNEVGKFAIFPQYIPHHTTIHNGESERITIALDFLLSEDYELYDETNPQKKSAILFDYVE